MSQSATELQELDLDELADKLRESRRELYELRFKLAVGQLDNHRQIREVRHDIGRILTFIRQREMGIVAQPHQEAAAAASAEVEAASQAPDETSEEEEGDGE